MIIIYDNICFDMFHKYSPLELGFDLALGASMILYIVLIYPSQLFFPTSTCQLPSQ